MQFLKKPNFLTIIIKKKIEKINPKTNNNNYMPKRKKRVSK